ncbi:MAG: hypothetical protein SVO26_08050 [Chloroflexota bacterium]|nr:hypothetical protein [Chloroflexota bacterium]
MKNDKYGIYLNKKDCKVMRITSPYWIPSGDEWMLLTDDPNMSLLKIRELAGEKGIVSNTDTIVWGDWSKVTQGK